MANVTHLCVKCGNQLTQQENDSDKVLRSTWAVIYDVYVCEKCHDEYVFRNGQTSFKTNSCVAVKTCVIGHCLHCKDALLSLSAAGPCYCGGTFCSGCGKVGYVCWCAKCNKK
jgi:hypothetical protein